VGIGRDGAGAHRDCLSPPLWPRAGRTPRCLYPFALRFPATLCRHPARPPRPQHHRPARATAPHGSRGSPRRPRPPASKGGRRRAQRGHDPAHDRHRINLHRVTRAARLDCFSPRRLVLAVLGNTVVVSGRFFCVSTLKGGHAMLMPGLLSWTRCVLCG